MSDPFRVDGKVAVVTAGASGIGAACAQLLAERGASVVVADVNAAGAAATAARIEAAGGVGRAVACDVTDKAQVDALVDAAVAEFGRLDVMANVVGIPCDGLLADMTEEQLDRLWAVNVKGQLFGCQAAMRVMAPAGGGSIVNVSSAAIDVPAPGYGLYAMTKAAVAMMTMTLSKEAGPLGIRVNCLAPGATLTPFTERHLRTADGAVDPAQYEQFVESMRGMSPLGVVGDPLDQAYLVCYLASDASRYCTGQIWRANGGQACAW